MKQGKKETNQEVLAQINPHAAGVDIGDEEIWVCVPEGIVEKNVRCFKSFTVEMQEAVRWLLGCGVETVAMEATGVYWVVLHDLMEEAGIEVYVVNGRHVANTKGRKSDIVDCQWLQQLHTYGLLKSSFHPGEEIRALRTVVRQREMLIRYKAAHIQHMQKALQLMNIKLSLVLSDVTGVTGLTIIRAIVGGERDPHRLATYRQSGCKHSEEEIAKALTGNYRAEHLFTLKQAVELHDFYQEQLKACDEQLEEMYQALSQKSDVDEPLESLNKRRKRRKNQLHFELRGYLYQIYGVDLVAVDGLDTITVQTILSEIGTDMSKWKTVKHFAAWLGLSPNHRITGGKIISRRTPKNNNRVAKALRLAAQSLARSQTALGHFYRRIRAKQGPAKANTATAHKLARIIYFMLVRRTPYQPPTLERVIEARQKKKLTRLEKQARKLGLQLTPLTPAIQEVS
ncbi:MAG: IS110 family transposase [Symploca sp. SIO1C4]|uniref:IS110 family transposase n=1 Tax=Symploca sp. SIO1C4 TaxID=2607765 RepID=A0A6B3NME1_9CYAN|nr:IS110 family transposase [Symploca sp. SIO1C4]